tara:strand:- start:2094 stop:2945 length:852 start_codon:yes stop_codon:yes gene_type:complete
MVSAPFITGALVGTLSDKLAGDKLNEANLAARAAENQAKDEKFKTGLNLAGTSGTDFSTRNFNAAGGIDLNQAGGPTAANVRKLATIGDYGKQQAVNEAISNFKPTIPNLAAAQGMVDRDNALTQSTVDRMYDQAVLKRGQTPLGATSSNYNASLMDAIGRVSDKTKFNREQQAASLQQTSLNQDLKNLMALRQAHTLDAPAPAFTDPNPGATAAQVATQMPTRTYDADLSEVTPYASGSKLTQTLMQQMALEDADRKRADLIRQLGDAGAFKGTTVPTIPVG